MGTKLLETEMGLSQNESVTYAVRKAIEAAVIQLVKDGEKKKLWEYKTTEKKEKNMKKKTKFPASKFPASVGPNKLTHSRR